MGRGPHSRDAYGLTWAQREAFMEWIVTGREPLVRSRITALAARAQLGFRGMTAAECLPRVMSRMPDLIPPESEMGRVLSALLRKREEPPPSYRFARELGMEGKGE